MPKNKLDSVLLRNFFDYLNATGYRYCVMNNYTGMPEIIPSDVDFAVEKRLFSQLDKIVTDFASQNQVYVTQKIWHGYNKCAYILSPNNIESFFRLQLDFFVDFCAKGFPNLMPIDVMLNNRREYKNFYIPAPEVEAPFVMERRIFKGDIELRHIDILYDIYESSPSRVESSFIEHFGKDYGTRLCDIIKNKDIALFQRERIHFYRMLKGVSRNNTSLSYRTRYSFMQCVRAFYRLSQPVGMNILVDTEFENRFDLTNALEILSGSFHGTHCDRFDKEDNEFISRLKFSIRKRWHKTTKCLSIVVSDDISSLERFPFKMVISFDIVTCESASEHSSNIDDFLNLALQKQANKTHRQFGLLFSPTSRGYVS